MSTHREYGEKVEHPVDRETDLDRLHAELGLKRLDPAWAKAEILLGLTAAGAGVFLLARSAYAPGMDALAGLAGLALFVLGGYLALAGSRSHVYRSNNALAAWVAAQVVRQKEADRPATGPP